MTREVLVLIRRVTLSALVLFGAAFATFELTATASPSPLPLPPAHEAPAAATGCPPSAHALAPSPASTWPQMTHL